MKITLNIEIDNPTELMSVATALTTMKEIISTTPVEPVKTPKACPSIQKPVKTPLEAPKETSTGSEYREALEVEARNLGITFRSDIKDSTLAQRIETFKKEQPVTPSKAEPITLPEDAEDELKELIKKRSEKKSKEVVEEVQEEEKKPLEEPEEEEKEPETPKEEEPDDTPFKEEDEESVPKEEKEEDEEEDTLKIALSSPRKRKAIRTDKLRKVKKVAWGE